MRSVPSTSPLTRLAIVGGRLVDPVARSIHDVSLVVGEDGIADHSPQPPARTVDATGCLVVPGLVDVHAHFFLGTGAPQTDPRTDLLPTGVTLAADAGSAGAATYEVLRTFVIPAAPLPLCAWLNIDLFGLVTAGRPRPRQLDTALVDLAVATVEQNRDSVVGIKVLVPGTGPDASDGVALVRRAVEAAARGEVPVMVHVDGGCDIEEVLALLRPGDVVTHALHGRQPNLLDERGVVRDAVWRARDRGVLFDLAPCGGEHFSWEIAERAAGQGFYPDLIGSDYVHVPGAEWALPDCLAIMVELGMPLLDVVAAATTTAARTLGRGEQHGRLLGGRSDVTVLRWGRERTYAERKIRSLTPSAVICDGRLAWEAETPDGGSG